MSRVRYVQAGDLLRARNQDAPRWDWVTKRLVKENAKDAGLFARTAPAWNCVTYLDGPHYTPGSGGCEWCGKSQREIAAEYAS
jgi:hypothetical protein